MTKWLWSSTNVIYPNPFLYIIHIRLLLINSIHTQGHPPLYFMSSVLLIICHYYNTSWSNELLIYSMLMLTPFLRHPKHFTLSWSVSVLLRPVTFCLLYEGPCGHQCDPCKPIQHYSNYPCLPILDQTCVISLMQIIKANMKIGSAKINTL